MKIVTRLKKYFLSPLGIRMSREQRNESRGVAILMVLISIVVMTSVVFDLRYNETIRYEMALRTRDSIKAEALAAGGLGWAQLFLVMQDKLQSILASVNEMGFSVPVDTVWQVPLSSDMLKGFVNGSIASGLGLDVEDALTARNAGEENGESDLRGGFGNFQGSFVVEMTDEESKISLDFGAPADAARRDTTRNLLGALFAPKRYDELFEGRDGLEYREDRPSMVANIHDYIDANEIRTNINDLPADWGRTGSGSETDIYRNDKGILPKNAYFDSLDELKLVHGVNDAFEEAFFDSLTIYSQGGKINILSAKDQVIEAVMRFCASGDPLFDQLTFAEDTLRKWRDRGVKKEGPMTVKGFTEFLEAQGLKIDKKRCEDILDVKSKIFTLTSKATVGTAPNEVTRTLTLVTRVVDNVRDKYYFRSR